MNVNKIKVIALFYSILYVTVGLSVLYLYLYFDTLLMKFIRGELS